MSHDVKGEKSSEKALKKEPPLQSTPEIATKPKSEYWTISYGQACRQGFSCRECRQLIPNGSDIVVRDGRKMRLFYHKDCFSGDPDPRTQQKSTFNTEERFKEAFQSEAPPVKGRGKWSTRSYGYSPNPIPSSSSQFARRR